MREASDLGIGAGIRRELAGRRIDLSKIKFPVMAGVVTLEGELSFVGLNKTVDETAVELKFIESSIHKIAGVKKVNFALTNWTRNEAGLWECDSLKSGYNSGHGSAKIDGEGIVCPDCDFVIRFCPCCGKPLGEANCGLSSSIRQKRPAPPIKPIIKKRRPLIQPITPSNEIEPQNIFKAPTLAKVDTTFTDPKPLFEEKVAVLPKAEKISLDPLTLHSDQADQADQEDFQTLPKLTIPFEQDNLDSTNDLSNPLPEVPLNAQSQIPSKDENSANFELKPSNEIEDTDASIISPENQLNVDFSSFGDLPPISYENADLKPCNYEKPKKQEDPFAGLAISETETNNSDTTNEGDPFADFAIPNNLTSIPEELSSQPSMQQPIPPDSNDSGSVSGSFNMPSPAPKQQPSMKVPDFNFDELLSGSNENDSASEEENASDGPPIFDLGNFSIDDDDTPLPPMKKNTSEKPKKLDLNKESQDIFASIFNTPSSEGKKGKGNNKNENPFGNIDLDLDLDLEVISTDSPQESSAPQKTKSAKTVQPPADDNPFNLGNIIDLDADPQPLSPKKKKSKDPFDLKDFDLSKFKI